MFGDENIPILPLHRVLFPKMILALNLKESQHISTIDYCLKNKKSFGVLGQDNLHRGAIGTTAKIQHVIKYNEDNQFDLLIIGKHRFKLRKMIESDDFFRGDIEYFEDEENQDIPRSRMEPMINLYRSYISRLGLKHEHHQDLIKIINELQEEREISYIIGQTIGFDNFQQRALLAETIPEKRIEVILSQLKHHEQIHQIARNLYEDNDYDPMIN